MLNNPFTTIKSIAVTYVPIILEYKYIIEISIVYELCGQEVYTGGFYGGSKPG